MEWTHQYTIFELVLVMRLCATDDLENVSDGYCFSRILGGGCTLEGDFEGERGLAVVLVIPHLVSIDV